MTVEAVAAAYARRQIAIARRVSAQALRAWMRIDTADLTRSWLADVGPQVIGLVVAGQRAAAGDADRYVDAALGAQHVATDPAGKVDPNALAGVASDGRPLPGLLYAAVTDTKTAIGAGASLPRALALAAATLDMLIRTQVADAGRVATGVAITTRDPAGYTRMLNPPSCPRCAILAGRWYKWNAGFLRHPRCDCRHVPALEHGSGDLRISPRAYFSSLSPTEQQRIFGDAGAAAIRQGADIGQVVNARRGLRTLNTASGQLLTTTEGTTRRGVAGRRLRTGQPRLMPEEIYRAAAGNRDRAIALLARHGYLL